MNGLNLRQVIADPTALIYRIFEYHQAGMRVVNILIIDFWFYQFRAQYTTLTIQ
ncbi:hypothetical protein D3C86_1828800 [compost metagenome]